MKKLIKVKKYLFIQMNLKLNKLIKITNPMIVSLANVGLDLMFLEHRVII